MTQAEDEELLAEYNLIINSDIIPISVPVNDLESTLIEPIQNTESINTAILLDESVPVIVPAIDPALECLLSTHQDSVDVLPNYLTKTCDPSIVHVDLKKLLKINGRATEKLKYWNSFYNCSRITLATEIEISKELIPVLEAVKTLIERSNNSSIEFDIIGPDSVYCVNQILVIIYMKEVVCFNSRKQSEVFPDMFLKLLFKYEEKSSEIYLIDIQCSASSFYDSLLKYRHVHPHKSRFNESTTQKILQLIKDFPQVDIDEFFVDNSFKEGLIENLFNAFTHLCEGTSELAQAKTIGYKTEDEILYVICTSIEFLTWLSNNPYFDFERFRKKTRVPIGIPSEILTSEQLRDIFESKIDSNLELLLEPIIVKDNENILKYNEEFIKKVFIDNNEKLLCAYDEQTGCCYKILEIDIEEANRNPFGYKQVEDNKNYYKVIKMSKNIIPFRDKFLPIKLLEHHSTYKIQALPIVQIPDILPKIYPRCVNVLEVIFNDLVKRLNSTSNTIIKISFKDPLMEKINDIQKNNFGIININDIEKDGQQQSDNYEHTTKTIGNTAPIQISSKPNPGSLQEISKFGMEWSTFVRESRRNLYSRTTTV